MFNSAQAKPVYHVETSSPFLAPLTLHGLLWEIYRIEAKHFINYENLQDAYPCKIREGLSCMVDYSTFYACKKSRSGKNIAFGNLNAVCYCVEYYKHEDFFMLSITFFLYNFHATLSSFILKYKQKRCRGVTAIAQMLFSGSFSLAWRQFPFSWYLLCRCKHWCILNFVIFTSRKIDLSGRISVEIRFHNVI